MVAAAKLRDDQRLGGRSADPSEISLELSSSLPVPAKAEPSIRLAGGVSARLEMYEEEEAPDDAGPSPGAGAGAGTGTGVGADVAGRVEKEEEEEEDGESESDGGGRTPPSVGKSAQFLTSTLHSAGTVGSTISSAGSIVPPSGVVGRGRDVPASVKQDAEGCLQLIEHSNKAVQTVRASRDKCFSLAQRMRRAKIPLERLVSGWSPQTSHHNSLPPCLPPSFPSSLFPSLFHSFATLAPIVRLSCFNFGIGSRLSCSGPSHHLAQHCLRTLTLMTFYPRAARSFAAAGRGKHAATRDHGSERLPRELQRGKQSTI
jgi:hypothetical protein